MKNRREQFQTAGYVCGVSDGASDTNKGEVTSGDEFPALRMEITYFKSIIFLTCENSPAVNL